MLFLGATRRMPSSWEKESRRIADRILTPDAGNRTRSRYRLPAHGRRMVGVMVLLAKEPHLHCREMDWGEKAGGALRSSGSISSKYLLPHCPKGFSGESRAEVHLPMGDDWSRTRGCRSNSTLIAGKGIRGENRPKNRWKRVSAPPPNCSTPELPPGKIGRAGLEPAASRLTYEVTPVSLPRKIAEPAGSESGDTGWTCTSYGGFCRPAPICFGFSVNGAPRRTCTGQFSITDGAQRFLCMRGVENPGSARIGAGTKHSSSATPVINRIVLLYTTEP